MLKLKTAVGLMSGTSMDGIDAALIKTDGVQKLEIIGHHALCYPDAFRARLKNGLSDACDITQRHERPGALARLEQDLTLYHADVVADLIAKLGYSPEQIDVIGFHGQTVLHRPQHHMSVQLADGALLAHKTRIDVVYDMRSNDMKHGGNGAPLIPVYHGALAAKLKGQHAYPLVFVNIGGIANLTWVDEGGNLAAFDCGPGNCLIDQWMEMMTGERFDRDGKAGLRGHVNTEIVERYLSLPILAQATRRSFDWRDFPLFQKDALKPDDGAATLAAITAAAIINSMNRLPAKPQTMIISGGGAKNQAIMQHLVRLGADQGTHVLIAKAIGLAADFLEAEAWGYLAVRSLYNLPLTYPSTTGCSQPVSGGVLIHPEKG